MVENTELMTVDNICNRVYVIRGQQVMLDYDLAEIYGYEVKRLNEQVKRNITRFPEDFMFQLTKDEIPEDFSKSQFATLNENGNRRGTNIKKLPYAFTEQGIYMLATVLRGELAEQQSIFIMRAFREMRHYIKQNQQFVTQSEMRLVTAKVSEISVQVAGVTEQGIYMLATVLRGDLAEQQSIFIMRSFREIRHYIKQNQQFVTQSEIRLVTAKVSEISAQVAGVVDWKNRAEQKFDDIQRSIDTLNENFVSEKDFKNFVIYKGQKFEADAAYIDIYQQAKKSIYVVDDYVNTKTLQLLSQKQVGVEVVLFTENGHGKRGFLTTAVVNDFVQEYPPLRIKPNADCHDRLIVVDYNLPTEQAFHCGASSKDAGKKLCAINEISETGMIHPVIDKLLLAPDKQI
ncbi:oRF6N domain [Clostridium sp. CAG:510]|nr:oRF6N domain [Clostridium sp. CAG:510]